MDKSKTNDKCNNCICKLFEDIKPGAVIYFAVRNSDVYFEEEVFTFISFNPKSCCVTFIRSEVNNLVIVDCTKISGVKIVQS